MAHDLRKKWRSDDVKLKEKADFSSLLLSDRVLSGLAKAGFRRPSPIQFEAIPIGRYGIDLLVQAKSGTGKTLVFTVLALEKLQTKLFRPQVLIMVPTREIATQICSVVKLVGSSFPKLTCYSFIGGLPVEEDKEKAYNCQIVVGTPGRLKQLVQIGCLPTASIRLFVLDEADQLFESSFRPAIEDIFNVLPKDKQVVATSATYPQKMKKLLLNYLIEPHIVTLSAKKLALLGIVHYAKVVPNSLMPFMTYKYKLDALENILKKLRYAQCLIFANGLAKVELLCRDIKKWGFSTTFLSSAKEQVDRLKAIDRLKQYKCKIFVSSDVAARGIDAENVDLVINFEIPMLTETYLHRAGRAGRYGSHGVTISLLCDKEIKSLGDMEMVGGFKTYKLPDPLPSNLIRNPVFGEFLIEVVKSDSSPSDIDICKDKRTNGSNDENDADEAQLNGAEFKGNARTEDQSSEEQESSTNTRTENGTAEQNLKNGDASNPECVPDVFLRENASPKKTVFKHKYPKTKNITPEKCSKENVVNVSKYLSKVPVLETSENGVKSLDLQCSEGVTSDTCHSNVDDIDDVSDSISKMSLKEVEPVKEKSVKHELIGNNNVTNDTTPETYDHTCINPNNALEDLEQKEINSANNVVEHVLDVVKQNKEDEKKSQMPLPSCTEKILETVGIETTKKSEHLSDIFNCHSDSFRSVKQSNIQDHHTSIFGSINMYLPPVSKNGDITDSEPFVSPNAVLKPKSENMSALSNTSEVIDLPSLSPEDILKARHEKQSAEVIQMKDYCSKIIEHGGENDNKDNITTIIDSLKENNKSTDNLTNIGSEGKFASYEEYYLCFRIKSFLQDYEGKKKDALSAIIEKDGLSSMLHAANDNCISVEKMKNLISEKSEFYYQVFNTYLQEHMLTDNSSDNNKVDKKSDIKNNETAKQHACSENKLEQKTVSEELERTSEFLHENSNNENDDVICDIPELASTYYRGEILYCRSDLDDSDSDSDAILAAMSSDKVKSNNALVDSSLNKCNSDSSPSLGDGHVHQNKRNQRENSYSSSESEFCSKSDSYSSSRSKKKFNDQHESDSSSESEFCSKSDSYSSSQSTKKSNDQHESDSSSDSEFSTSSSNSDSSSYKRSTKSKKKNIDNFHKNYSTSDSEYSSDSSDSDSSSCRRNFRSKKRDLHNLHETNSSSDSESSSLSADADSSFSYKHKTHSRRDKVSNLYNPCNTFHMEQNSTPYTNFSSVANNSIGDYSKYLPGVETPYSQYNHSHCKNVHASARENSQFQICARHRSTHCCAKKSCKEFCNRQKKGCIRKNHEFADNSISANLGMSTNYSETHSHAGSCYMPSSHRCHPVMPHFSCSNKMCAEWYNIFYAQWMCIQRHANLPF